MSSDILIVDDDQDNREMLSRLVRRTGCEVRTAVNGRDALESIDRSTPDLIVLDLMMPEVDGFEVVAQLQQRGLAKQIPIMVLTSKDLTEDDRRRLNGHVRSISTKAATSRDELLQKINAYLSICTSVPEEVAT